MTPRPALLKLAACAFLLAFAGAADARPLDLSTDAGVQELARWMKDYRDVSRAHWVIAAPTKAEAEAKKSAVASQLGASDANLMQRVETETVQDGLPRAWLNPIVGAASLPSSCTWQVWVDDPAAPSANEDTAMTLLYPNDRIPVGPQATFRVGHAGLVQSHLYAFGETHAGSVRDLASAPDVNIPVTRDPGGETIVLAAARQPSAFFESVKLALAQSQGERVDLGPRYDVRVKMMGGARGIGANIQAIPESMIAPTAAPATAVPKDAVATALLESCVYQMTPRP